MFPDRRHRVVAGSAVLLALAIAPAPLLPPHRFAELMQSVSGVDWKIAYLVAAVVLQSVFYASLGVLAALAVNRATTLLRRLLQFGIVPLVVIAIALCIRSVKAGHLPVWVNAVVPVISCYLGVILGLGFLYRYWKITLSVVVLTIGCALWAFLYRSPTALSRATEVCLHELVAAGPRLPQGDPRFGALLQTAFESTPGGSTNESAILHNRAAIIAWGIVVGHPQLARFVGMDPNGELVRQAVAQRQGTPLLGREDWTQHYALSAALTVLENPLVSDAAGLMKEQLDALTGGSGFSFGDLVADRAGVRFARAATTSEAAAKAMQVRLQNGFISKDFFPPIVDFPENLTTEEFRRDFDGVGGQRYRREILKIETKLDACSALSPAADTR